MQVAQYIVLTKILWGYFSYSPYTMILQVVGYTYTKGATGIVEKHLI